MSKVRSVAVAAVLSMTLLGCHGHGDDHGKEAGSGGAGHGDVHGGSQADPTGVIELVLDDGKKWRVDDHTRGSAVRLSKIVRGAERVSSVEGATRLAEAVEAELGELIRGCTMTGPAHDQLHVVLAALFPRVEQLKTETDVGRLASVHDEVVAVLDAYDSHFE